MEASTVYSLPIATALIVGLVAVGKQAGFPDRFAGLLAVGLGILYGVVWSLDDVHMTYTEGVVLGIIAGLSASGLWSTTTNVVKSSSRK